MLPFLLLHERDGLLDGEGVWVGDWGGWLLGKGSASHHGDDENEGSEDVS